MSSAPISLLLPKSGSNWRPLAVALSVLGATAILTASSWVAVPVGPVPMTMQTFAVTLIGALFGWRLGAATVVIWLAQAAAGLPVLAGGTGGIAPFFGPTAGYLVAFPLAAALAGYLAERGWTGRRSVLAFVAALGGNALILALGGAWIASFAGWEAALATGVTPFLLGAVLKSALAAAVLRAIPGPKR